MNNEIETVGDLIAALQRFDATLPVRTRDSDERLWHASPCVYVASTRALRDGELSNPGEYVEL